LQKNIAMDLDLAPSTIALNSRLALESFGIARKPSRVHPLLMLAAKAASTGSTTLARCAIFATRQGCELLVVSAPRPDLRLATLLPSAELAVIRRLVEGLSYVEIAHTRGTSTRTIANQITAVFRRLHVSGRNELVQRLFANENLGRHTQRTSEVAIPKEGPASSRESGVRPAGQPWAGARRSA
jgi:DNA-binding CsgD family transcriptional regulator